jgi:hypothetical protein
VFVIDLQVLSCKTRAGICSTVERSLNVNLKKLLSGAVACTRAGAVARALVACILRIHMKIFVCFIKQGCLLAARATYVVHANADRGINSLCHFICMTKHICLFYKTS